MASWVLPRRADAARDRLPPPAAPFRDGTPLSARSARWLLLPALLAAAAAGAATVAGPGYALAGLLAALLGACVWRWPPLAAYLIIGLTPLTVGISRGAALPVVRPNEAVALLAGGALAARGITRLRSGQLPRLRLDRIEVAMVVMAIANSVLPLLWMAVRQEAITPDDILYSLVLWKFLGLYAIVRASITSGRQVRRCLWLAVAAACVVALIAVLQSLDVLGVSRLLATFYAPSGGSGLVGLQNSRGASTLGLPAATADMAIFSLAIVTGLWAHYRRHRLVLAGAAVLLVAGALSAGEFSSAIGLVAGIICIALGLRKPRLLYAFVPGLLIAGYALRPVIARRLSGFQSASGLPVSWTGRVQNLQSYFWPTLFSHGNFLLGVRPAARVAVPSQVTGFVWIESGYTWLLWGGGIPLLAAFCYFAFITARRGWRAARGAADARSVAGLAVFTAVIVIAVVMLFDPHLTYRGSADSFFFLIALTAPRRQPPARAASPPETSNPPTEVGTDAE